MQGKKRYTLGASKLAMAYYEGFVQRGSTLYTVPVPENSGDNRHFVILDRFCSYEGGTKWGRFHCKSALSPSSTLRIYAFAADMSVLQAEETSQYFHDGSVPWEQKCSFFQREGVQFASHEDVLLYALAGEYLWIAAEIGSGFTDRAAGQEDWIGEMFLDSQGDNFMWTFPEIYQEEGGFFHRYMSVFSSVYQDMADTLAHMDRYLEPDTAPVSVLAELAGWFGQDAIDGQMLRSLMPELYALNRMKGTKEAIRRLIWLVLGEEAAIVERNRLEGYLPDEVRETCQRLYGASRWDVTILLGRPGDERLQSRMLHLLNQFKPVRSRLKLVFCPDSSRLDTYCYLDHNAVLSTKGEGSVDKGVRMDGTAVLK